MPSHPDLQVLGKVFLRVSPCTWHLILACYLSASVKKELSNLGCVTVALRSSHGRTSALKSDKSYIGYGYHTEQNTSVNAECARASC